MKKIIAFFLLVVVVAGVSAFCAVRLSRACAACGPASPSCCAHDWLHEKLQLTPAQKQALAPVEERFHANYEQASKRLAEANRELARTLSEEKTFSPAVATAIENVHHRMGELQKISIQHLYDMKTVLTPEQNERLLKYAQQALEENP